MTRHLRSIYHFTTSTKGDKVSAPRTQRESLVEGMAGVFLMRRCAGDGGRSSVVVLQEGATNHPKVRRSRAVRVERWGKSRVFERGRCDPLKANVSEPQMKCRNLLDDIKSGYVTWTCDELGGSLLTAQVVSGMYAARAWVGLLHGTWEPVVSRDGQPVAHGLRLAGYGRNLSGRNREDESTDAGHRGGPSGSSGKGSVMGLERSGRAVQAKLLGNHEVVGGTNG
jgi:hypothetical protein